MTEPNDQRHFDKIDRDLDQSHQHLHDAMDQMQRVLGELTELTARVDQFVTRVEQFEKRVAQMEERFEAFHPPVENCPKCHRKLNRKGDTANCGLCGWKEVRANPELG